MKTIIIVTILFLFSIKESNSQVINIISPKKNDRLKGGSNQSLIWNVDYEGKESLFVNSMPHQVKIQISTDGGKLWSDMDGGKPIQINSKINNLPFQVPNKDSKNSIVKIYSAGNSIFKEEVSDTFSIEKSELIQIVYPGKDEKIEVKSEEKSNEKIVFKIDESGNVNLIDTLKLLYVKRNGSKDSVIIDTNIKIKPGIFTYKWKNLPYLDNDFYFNSFEIQATIIDKEKKTSAFKSEKFTFISKRIFRDKSKDYLINVGTTFNFQDEFKLTGMYFNIFKDFKDVWINESTSLLLGLTFDKSKEINNNQKEISSGRDSGSVRNKTESDINSYNFEALIYSTFPFKNWLNLDYLYFGYLYAEKRRRDISSVISYKKDTINYTTDTTFTVNEHFLGLSPMILMFESENIEIKACPIIAWNIRNKDDNAWKYIMKFNLLERNSKINFGGEIRDFLFKTGNENSSPEVLLYFAKEFAMDDLINIFFK